MSEDKKPESKEEEPTARDTPEELLTRAEKARVEAIRAIAPPSLRGLADQLALEGKTLEEGRAALLVAYAATKSPVGTPEVAAIEPKSRKAPSEELKDMSAETLIRCLAGDN